MDKAGERRVEQTEDGSYTLFVPELDEHYHSVKGAYTESVHIFIEMGLKASTVPCPRVLEIGFGTGLNAVLTLEEAIRSQRKIHYTGLELYPLPWDILEKLDFARMTGFRKLHEAPWEEEVKITPEFTLRKIQADANRVLLGKEEEGESSRLGRIRRWDVVYFDAFAPEKQPEMWSQELFNRLYVLLEEGGILTTYCAKGVVRRMLQAAGFTVERLSGPPGGKREILRARKEIR